jgi:imidazolonepropionase-like amidohydrolase
MASGGVTDPLSDASVRELSGEQMAEAVTVAHRVHKKVMAHAHALAGIRAAVEAGVDSIEHGSVLDDETAALMSKKGTWLIPTFYIQEHNLADGSRARAYCALRPDRRAGAGGDSPRYQQDLGPAPLPV